MFVVPYISRDDRPPMDELVGLMQEFGVQPDGKLNYLLYAFCKRTIPPSYNSYKNFIEGFDGELMNSGLQLDSMGNNKDEIALLIGQNQTRMGKSGLALVSSSLRAGIDTRNPRKTIKFLLNVMLFTDFPGRTFLVKLVKPFIKPIWEVYQRRKYSNIEKT